MTTLSIDIETTGLDPSRHRILEVAAVIYDPYGSIRESFNRLLMHPDQETLPMSPYCAKLHAQNGLWDRYSEHEKVCEVGVFNRDFKHWLTVNKISEPITVTGKNFGAFDLQFLNRLPNWNIKLRHRFLDPAILYMQEGDTVLPDLNTCLKRAGIEASTDHTALADAILTARLVIEGLSRKHAERKTC